MSRPGEVDEIARFYWRLSVWDCIVACFLIEKRGRMKEREEKARGESNLIWFDWERERETNDERGSKLEAREGKRRRELWMSWDGKAKRITSSETKWMMKSESFHWCNSWIQQLNWTFDCQAIKIVDGDEWRRMREKAKRWAEEMAVERAGSGATSTWEWLLLLPLFLLFQLGYLLVYLLQVSLSLSLSQVVFLLQPHLLRGPAPALVSATSLWARERERERGRKSSPLPSPLLPLPLTSASSPLFFSLWMSSASGSLRLARWAQVTHSQVSFAGIHLSVPLTLPLSFSSFSLSYCNGYHFHGTAGKLMVQSSPGQLVSLPTESIFQPNKPLHVNRHSRAPRPWIRLRNPTCRAYHWLN